MRNLEVLRCIPVTEIDGSEGPSCLTVDCDTGSVYTATATNIIGFNPNTQQVCLDCS